MTTWILIFIRIVSFSICFWWTIIISISILIIMLDYFLAIIWVIFWNICSIFYTTSSSNSIIIFRINIYIWRRYFCISIIIIRIIIISIIKINLNILWRYSINSILNTLVYIIPDICISFRRRFLFMIISLIIINITNLFLRCIFYIYII